MAHGYGCVKVILSSADRRFAFYTFISEPCFTTWGTERKDLRAAFHGLGYRKC